VTETAPRTVAETGASGAAPLAGLRVLELGTSRAGAFAGAMLADMGADVVKVEGSGAERAGTAGRVDWRRVDRLAFDRGKRSVVIDLVLPAGQDVLLRLVGWSDVLLDECGAHVLSGLGLDDEDLLRRNPELVHCTVTPFGGTQTAGTPTVTASSEELVVQALSGNMDLTGHAGGPPDELGIPLCDLASGVYAVVGILGAVVSGRQTRVEVAKMDVAVALLSYMAVGYFADGDAPTRVGTGHSTIFPYNSFPALDGEVVVAPFTQRFWRNFCTATAREDLTEVDTYKDFASRLRHKEALLKVFEPVMAGKTVAEWVEIFRVADVPAGPVLSVPGALTLPQTIERGLTPELTLETGERMQCAGSPYRFHYSDGTTFAPEPTRPPGPPGARQPSWWRAQTSPVRTPPCPSWERGKPSRTRRSPTHRA